MGNKSLAIIKPDAMRANHFGKIIDRILTAGFKITELKIARLTLAQAETFYAVHRERPFYGELTSFVSSGDIMPIVLEKDDAVSAFRDLIGATNPAEATEGTIRKEFATSVGENAIHGSDSDENAEKEVAFFFPTRDIQDNL